MAENSGAAQPLVDWVKDKEDTYNKVKSWFSPKPDPKPAQPPADAAPPHDRMLDEANASFQKAAADSQKPATPAAPARPGKRMLGTKGGK